MNNKHNLWLTIGLSLSTLPVPTIKWFQAVPDTQLTASQERLAPPSLCKAAHSQITLIFQWLCIRLLMTYPVRLTRQAKRFDAHQVERETWLAVGRSLAVFRLNLHS